MRILITGGAGFLGSHLCEALLKEGNTVVCVDDLSTGRRENVAPFLVNPLFTFVQSDVSDSLHLDGHLDVIAHLASPASPPDYHRLPLQTLAVGSRGTENALRLAHEKSARFVLASTSEIYGDPSVHPQPEDYCGNVSSVGPRSVYDEAKRFAEAISMAYARSCGVNVGILRIFNTFGPRMRPGDGRVVSTFITQALNGDPLTIYGDGTQTRSFCYVEDLIRGIIAMIQSTEAGPINLGNPAEKTVLELAQMVLNITGSSSTIEFHRLPIDDPIRRRPDIGRAALLLEWLPQVPTMVGLRSTIEYFQSRPLEVMAAAQAVAGAQFEGGSRIDVPVPSASMPLPSWSRPSLAVPAPAV